MSEYLKPKDMPTVFPFPLKTLERWRAAHMGPPFYRVNGHVLYKRSEVESWIEAHAATAA